MQKIWFFEVSLFVHLLKNAQLVQGVSCSIFNIFGCSWTFQKAQDVLKRTSLVSSQLKLPCSRTLLYKKMTFCWLWKGPVMFWAIPLKWSIFGHSCETWSCRELNFLQNKRWWKNFWESMRKLCSFKVQLTFHLETLI